MRWSGAGERLEVDVSRSETGELFDVLVQQDNYADFLPDTYVSGNSPTKEQVVSYTTLLMTEEGFLNNLTPLQLLHSATASAFAVAVLVTSASAVAFAAFFLHQTASKKEKEKKTPRF
jgi:hypothetical protein